MRIFTSHKQKTKPQTWVFPHTIPFWLFFITLAISVFGIFLLYESSSYNALLQIGDKYHFVKYQLVWLILGVTLCLVVSRVSYGRLYRLSLPLLGITFLLLILVFVPGIGLELKGSHRWIDFKLFVFQPSELLKISLVIYLAAWLSLKEKGRLLAFFLLFLSCVILIALQPDMGTAAIVSFTSLALYFLSGARLGEMLLIGLLLVFLGGFFIMLEPYRIARFTAFKEFSTANIMDTSYHLRQIIIALGSGGLMGTGFGKSIQKYAYLPESSTDSIFPIFAEEGGFIGSVILIAFFMMQFFLGFLIGIRTKDAFGRLLAMGIIVFLSAQTFVNLASQVVLIPLTGVPLPFLSYGGSSLVINFLAIGILLSVGKERSF